MGHSTEEEEESPGEQIRPLDIGYELLPEGVTAADFIQYKLICLPKPKLYRQNELTPHDLLGDKAVIRRELLEEDPIEHSELWIKIVSKLHPELLPSLKGDKKEEQEYLECHIAEEPTQARLLRSLMPRKKIEENSQSKQEDNEKVKSLAERTLKKRAIVDYSRFDKLFEKVNWLKFCKEESENDSETEE